MNVAGEPPALSENSEVGHGVVFRLCDDEHGAVLLTSKRPDEELEPGGQRERLVRLVSSEGHKLLG